MIIMKTVLFDLDGTIINTNPLIIASFKHTLENYYPGKYTEEDIISFIGEPLETSFQRVDEKRAQEMVEMYRKHNAEMHDELVEQYDNIETTLQELTDKGIKCGIVSTKTRVMVLRGLKLMKLDHFFDVVVTIDDVQFPKPNPEPLQLAMKALHAEPSQTMMVGDSISDIQAAQNAGVVSVGVSWSIKGRAALESAEPDYIIDDMGELLDIIHKQEK